MPKKIQNPLTTGLPSKVFLLCYLGEESGYTLTRKIYPDKRYMPTAKIYDSLKKLHQNHVLEMPRPRKPYAVKIGPVIDQISATIQRHKTFPLDEKERNLISKLILSDEFRSYVKSYVLRKHGSNGAEEKIFKSSNEEVNALAIIEELLGIVSTQCYMALKFRKQSPKEDADLLERHYKSISSMLGEVSPTELANGIRQYNKVAEIAERFPLELLAKLATLWPASQTLIFTYLYNFWEKKE